MDFWIAECVDIFGGYGLRAFGRTKGEAIDTFMESYREISPRWNSTQDPVFPSFDAICDYFGGGCYPYSTGCAYFGGDTDLD